MTRTIGILLGMFVVQSAMAPASAQEVDQKPPFVTTPQDVVQHMLAMAATTSKDFVIDLGSGDGRIVISAAKEIGARGVGIELDADLVARSRENARRAGVADRAEFVQGDVLREDISKASVVTVYLLPWLMEKLQPRLLGELRPGTRIVSHAFTMPGWKPDRVDTVKITERLQYHGETTRTLLWVVPAQVRGAWSAKSSNGEWRVRVSQNFQELEIDGSLDGKALRFEEVVLSGTAIRWRTASGAFQGRVEGDRIVGEFAASAGGRPVVFQRER